MVISRADETDILVNLYKSLWDIDPWTRFLSVLGQEFGADMAALVLQDGSEASATDVSSARYTVWSAGENQTLETLIHGLMNQQYKNISSILRLRTGRVYALDELLDQQGLLKLNLGELVLPMENLPSMRVMRVQISDAVSVWLIMARTSRDLASSASLGLSNLVPHVTVAVISYLRIVSEHRRKKYAAAMGGAFGLGWILLRQDGLIMDICPSALAALRRVMGVHVAIGTRLQSPDPNLNRQMLEAIAVRTVGRPVRHIPVRHLFVIAQDPLTELILQPDPEGPCLGYLRWPCEVSEHLVRNLIQRYALPPAEARFAALIVRGMDISTASATLGLTLETGRS
jgi:hypothetical protein